MLPLPGPVAGTLLVILSLWPLLPLCMQMCIRATSKQHSLMSELLLRRQTMCPRRLLD